MSKKTINQELHTVIIENFSHDGRGIARINGKTTFIQQALPGEEVVFRYLRIKKSYDDAEVVEVLQKSLQRVEPLCKHYQICGGCNLQHVSAAEQIHIKQELVLDLLLRIGHVTPQQSLSPIILDDTWHYRTKARLSVRYVVKKQSTLVGFRERNHPGYIAEINSCVILDAIVGEKIDQLRSLLDTFESGPVIAQIEIAIGDNGVALIFRNLAELTAADQVKLCKFVDDNSAVKQFYVYLQPNGIKSVTLLYPLQEHLYLQYKLIDFNLILRFQPTDFTQINRNINQLMLKQAIELLALQTTDVVLDLFCGIGNFSLPIAQFCNTVIGIEDNVDMVARATMNAQYNHINNVKFYDLNLNLDTAVTCLLEIINDLSVNKMLLDPPRTGALAIVQQIEKLSPKMIVYVSCNPATLARDTNILVNSKGYCLKSVGVMDMFPHTEHVEVMALFEQL